MLNHNKVVMLEHNNLKLDYQLCFALYAATHAVTRAYRAGLERAGITYTQYLVMMVLWQEDGMSVGKIAHKLELDSATLTPMLKKLEAVGFISRTRNKLDERVVEIALTEKGNQLQHEVASVQEGVACKTGLDDEAFKKLRADLHHLVERMSAPSALVHQASENVSMKNG